MHQTGPAVERATQAASRYINKQVSLLSTSDVRYNGELYTVDPAETSIALKHVDCLGTQDRRQGSDAISASDCTYEFIIFRAVNIKSLRLEEGDRHDLTREILEPLRQATNEIRSNQKRTAEAASKRRVGYDQTRTEYPQTYDSRYTPQQQAQAPPPSQQAPPQGYYYNQASHAQPRPSSRAQYPQGTTNSSSRAYAPPPPYYDSRRAPSGGQYGGRGYSSQYSGQPVSSGQGGYYGGRAQAPPPQQAVSSQYPSSRGGNYAPSGAPYGGSRAYYSGQGSSYRAPPPQSSRAVRDGRSYYQQSVGYNRDSGRSASRTAPNYRSNREYYDTYTSQGGGGGGGGRSGGAMASSRTGYYQQPRDPRGYPISQPYVNESRRPYYPSRSYYNQRSVNYSGGGYPRQGVGSRPMGGGGGRPMGGGGRPMGGGGGGGQRRDRDRNQNRRMSGNMGGMSGGRVDSRGGGGGGRNSQEAPGTGAFLQSKNQQEDPTDMNKLKDDFDFGDATVIFKNINPNEDDDSKNDQITTTATGADKSEDNGSNEENTKNAEAKDENAESGTNNNKIDDNDGLKEDKKDIDQTIEQLATMNLDIEPKYDKSKSFFDNLPQETRKDKKFETRDQNNMDRNIDAETFGDFAKHYRSKHIGHRYQNRQQTNNTRNAPRRQRGTDVPRGYDIRGFQTRRRNGTPETGRPDQQQQQQQRRRNYDESAQARWRKRD